MADFTCQRCGLCCMTLSFALKNVLADDDKQELHKWMLLHHCEPIKNPDGSLAINVPMVCSWLGFDHDTGKYRCKNYDNRPAVCQEYICQRAVEISIAKAVKENGPNI